MIAGLRQPEDELLRAGIVDEAQGKDADLSGRIRVVNVAENDVAFVGGLNIRHWQG